MPTLERKMLGIFLYRHEHQTHQTDRTTAAERTGQALGYSRKTISKWVGDFSKNKGEFSRSTRGKYRRNTLLDQEDITRKSVKWLREKVHDSKFNLTGKKFQIWFNDYLTTLQLPSSFQNKISEMTALRYMKRLGFYKQGYADGHDRDDVLQYRMLYLNKLGFWKLPTCLRPHVKMLYLPGIMAILPSPSM